VEVEQPVHIIRIPFILELNDHGLLWHFYVRMSADFQSALAFAGF
jgi:hypothetical protein